MIGIEPNTTLLGLEAWPTPRRGSGLLTLEPGAELSAELRLHVFKPTGRVNGADVEGGS